jgi:regulator of replication initiation timing
VKGLKSEIERHEEANGALKKRVEEDQQAIDALRQQVVSVGNENVLLKKELEYLREASLEAKTSKIRSVHVNMPC